MTTDDLIESFRRAEKEAPKVRPLTDKQARMLAFVIESMLDGAPPTIRGWVRAFSFKSTNAAADFRDALERKGWIARYSPFEARGIRLLRKARIPVGWDATEIALAALRLADALRDQSDPGPAHDALIRRCEAYLSARAEEELDQAAESSVSPTRRWGHPPATDG